VKEGVIKFISLLVTALVVGWIIFSLPSFAHAANFDENREPMQQSIQTFGQMCYDVSGDKGAQLKFINSHPYITSYQDAELMVFVDCQRKVWGSLFDELAKAGSGTQL
jgi:hypothetical protein